MGEVVLNVYDLPKTTDANDWLGLFGLGVYHSGVVVSGQEFSFGGHDSNASGIFTVPPGEAPECTLRASIPMGTSSLSQGEIERIVFDMGRGDYRGMNYSLTQRNCNHFSQDFCSKVLGKSIPGWVNRLAWVGNATSCAWQPLLGLPGPSEEEAERRVSNERSASFLNTGPINAASVSQSSSHVIAGASGNVSGAIPFASAGRRLGGNAGETTSESRGSLTRDDLRYRAERAALGRQEGDSQQ